MSRTRTAAVVLAALTFTVGAAVPAHAESFGKSSTRQTVAHKPLARTVIDVDWVSAMGSNIVTVSGTVRHQGPKGWVPSQRSPIWVLRWNHFTLSWEKVRVTTTDARGQFYAELTAPSGIQAFRFVRPVGKTVAAATSGVYSVDVTAEPSEAP